MCPPAVSVATKTVPAGSGPAASEERLVCLRWSQVRFGAGEQIDQRGGSPAPVKSAITNGSPSGSNTAWIWTVSLITGPGLGLGFGL